MPSVTNDKNYVNAQYKRCNRDVANKLVKNLKDCRDVFDGYLSHKGATKASMYLNNGTEERDINISDLVHESIDLLIELLEGEEND